MTERDVAGLIGFLRSAEKLKEVRRQGWLDRGVPIPESSADHSWAVALMVWLLASSDSEIDPHRAVLLALVHDLPEAIAGDATPFDRHRNDRGEIAAGRFREIPSYGPEEAHRKREREEDALLDMTAGLPAALRDQIVDAWSEYDAGATPEARFVRQIDKLETLLQAELYLDRYPDIVIDSFRTGTNRDVEDPELRDILATIQGASSGDVPDQSG